MKKILFLFLLIINFNSVKAETYYSQYSNFTDYTDIEIIASDTKDVETERFFKWYKENKVLGDYYMVSSNNLEYPYIDKKDYIIKPYTDWSTDKPTSYQDRTTEERNVYYYQDMKEVRYLHFKNASGSYGALRISEIEVTVSNTKINYSTNCSSCNPDFNYYVKNGIVNENMSFIYNGGSLLIDLNNYYPIDKINVKLYLYDEGIEAKKYLYGISRDNNDNYYASVNQQHYFTYDNLSEIVPINISINNIGIKNPEYYNEIRTLQTINSSITRKVRIEKEYRYQDKLYRYYKIEKEYYDKYLNYQYQDYMYIDFNNYKDFYRYRTREKVELADEIIITDKNKELKDFIIYSTVDNILINSNINYNKNGIYNVEYVLPFETINKEVLVNIKENDIQYQQKIDDLENEINQLLNENEIINNLLNNVKKEIEEKNINIKELNNNIEKYKINEEKTIKNYNLKISGLENEINSLIEKNQGYQKTIDEKNHQLQALINENHHLKNVNKEEVIINENIPDELKNNEPCNNEFADNNYQLDKRSFGNSLKDIILIIISLMLLTKILIKIYKKRSN